VATLVNGTGSRSDATLVGINSGTDVASGAAVGFATAALSRSYGIVVPAATVSRVVDALLAHGRVARPWLGLGTQSVPLPPAAEQAGLLVTSLAAAARRRRPASWSATSLQRRRQGGGRPARRPRRAHRQAGAARRAARWRADRHGDDGRRVAGRKTLLLKEGPDVIRIAVAAPSRSFMPVSGSGRGPCRA